MPKINNFLINLATGFVGAAVLFGGAWLLGAFENDVIIEDNGEVIVVEGAQGPAGVKGSQGPRGLVGLVGPMGPTGPQGTTGTTSSTDITALADAVVDELEDREDRISVTITGGIGDTAETLVILADDTYEFKFRKYTLGDFEVSLESEDGDVIELLNVTGHVNTQDVAFLTEGTWTIHVSSTGSWIIEVEQL